MPRLPRVVIGLLLASVTLVVIACSDPPTKEMNQAQGAIDAARAAGAEQYAPDDYRAAVAALQRSHDAVAQRDYRQALNYALDARERAHDAARSGAERMAQVRSDAEQTLTTLTLAVQTARTRFTAAEAAKVPDAQLATLREESDLAQNDLQKARTELSHQNYNAARDLSKGALDRIHAVTFQLNNAIDAKTGRRPPRRPGH
jgi:Domain of unknown function (DUF4398)